MADYSKQKERLAEVHDEYFEYLTKIIDEGLEYTYDYGILKEYADQEQE